MENWKKIDKDRLTVFTDAIMAIIMTILVLDLKVPINNIETDSDLKLQLVKQLPHFYGFIISFSMIALIWFSHHNLMKVLNYANRPFTILNFLFSGTIAMLPFSTALVSEYPFFSLAVTILAVNLLLMNIFLAGMYIYIAKKNLTIPNAMPEWYRKIKQNMGIAGVFLLLAAVLFSFFSPKIALLFIIAVPLMHLIPLNSKNRIDLNQ